MRRDLAIVGVLSLVAVAWLVERAHTPRPHPAGVGATELLRGAPDAFRRVTGPRQMQFPADHAMHPGYRSEWWYFTGNLADDQGRRFGFQFTLFRFGLGTGDKLDTARSDFSTDAVWMAHFAISDFENRAFITRERFARGALGLAGATAERWWLRDWQVTRGDGGWHLELPGRRAGLVLRLVPRRPIVLQGDRGYSQKGPEPGNASRYYSITRLAVEGELRLDGRSHRVSGLAWLDREWGSSQLGPDLAGWDWFALQLADGRDLMLYRLRTNDGRASRFSAGTIVEPDGRYRILEAPEFDLRPLNRWRDRDGIRWPVVWRVRVPSESLDLRVEPAFEAQRWRATVGYWEGAVTVHPAGGGDPVGRGYLELSGYAETAGPRGTGPDSPAGEDTVN